MKNPDLAVLYELRATLIDVMVGAVRDEGLQLPTELLAVEDTIIPDLNPTDLINDLIGVCARIEFIERAIKTKLADAG